MARVIRGDLRRAARLAAAHPTALVVSVGEARAVREPVAHIGVSVKDPALARRLEGAIARAVRGRIATEAPALEAVRIRSRKMLERLRDRVAGAIAVVPVTDRNLRWLQELVDALRDAGVAGVQLVWDGREPSREVAEGRVFAVLEHARATPGRPPVVLARGEEPVEALRMLAQPTDRPDRPRA
jgi:hypothetical protein